MRLTDDADDPKAAAMTLVEKLQGARKASELGMLKLGDLKNKLRQKGASAAVIDSIDDTDDPKAAAIKLLLEKQADPATSSLGALPEKFLRHFRGPVLGPSDELDRYVFAADEVAAILTTGGNQEYPAWHNWQGYNIARQFVKSALPYIIHYCSGPDLATAKHSVPIDPQHVATLHRKTSTDSGQQHGVGEVQPFLHQGEDGSQSALLLFEGGFPYGGDGSASVHAPWGTCDESLCQQGGSIIIQIPLQYR